MVSSSKQCEFTSARYAELLALDVRLRIPDLKTRLAMSLKSLRAGRGSGWETCRNRGADDLLLVAGHYFGVSRRISMPQMDLRPHFCYKSSSKRGSPTGLGRRGVAIPLGPPGRLP